MNESELMGEAIVVRCHRCGASLTPTNLVVANCGHCGHRQPLDAHTSARWAQYLRRFASAHQHVAQQHAEAEKYERWAEYGSTRNSYILTGGLLVLCTAPLLVGQLWEAGILSERAAWGLGIGIGVLTIVAIAFLVWPRQRVRRQARKTETSLASCPTCGASSPFRHGAAATACLYCDTTLMASGAIVRDGLDAARRHVRTADLQRLHAERSFALDDDVFSFRLTAVIAVSMCIGVPLVAAFARTGQEGPTPMAFHLVVACLGLLAIVGWMAVRSHRKRRLREAIEALAEKVSGQAAHHPTATLAWLNAFWPAPFDMTCLSNTKRFGAVSLALDGYAVHILLATCASRPPQLFILVAAWLPGISDGGRPTPVPASAGLQSLRQAGFHLHQSTAGMNLVATEAFARDLDAEPRPMGQLDTVLAQAVRSARHLGAIPVGAALT